jgi:hypothetical protein
VKTKAPFDVLSDLKTWAPVKVDWVDSQGNNLGWIPDDSWDDFELSETQTVGMIVRVTDEFVVLALGHDYGLEAITGTMMIPFCSIRGVCVL